MSELKRPARNLEGTILEGAYRLVRLIGEGGMGAVYEGVQLRLNKRVAIKLMARELSARGEAVARFHREAEITSHLGHPHLVQVIDFGTAESGEPYLVMEYLEGEDLEHRLIRDGKLSMENTAHIVRQVASALGAAHAKEVVHRDLKPANIFLLQVPGEPEFAKVLDFGISKMKAARSKLTRATARIGTPNYMSPEQAAGRVDETDHRADQWALACIAWEMLSGRTPFEADEVSALFYQITNLEPPSLIQLVPNVHPRVEHVLRRALCKVPTGRFQSIREFSRSFEAAVLDKPVDMTVTPISLPTVVPIERDARKITTFSQSTGEITSLDKKRSLGVRVGGFLGIAAVAAVAAFFVLRTVLPKPQESTPSANATIPSPGPAVIQTTPAPNVHPLPSPPVAAPEPLAVKPAKAERPQNLSKKDRAHAVPAKPKPAKNAPKRRIFQEL